MMPVVTATTAFFWFRPVAKALGMLVFTMATLGMGRSAMAHSLDIIWWSSGASFSETIFAPMDARIILSEK